MIKNIEYEKLINVNLDKKYIIQNQTADQREFVIRFLNLIKSLNNNICLYFNNNNIPYLRTSNSSIDWTKNKIVRVYSAEYIKKLFSYFYSKDELHNITQKLNIPKDISGIIHSYCLLG
jgi:hypothetical protein